MGVSPPILIILGDIKISFFCISLINRSMELNPSGDLDDIYKTYIKIIKSKNKNQTKNDFFSKLDNKHFTLD